MTKQNTTILLRNRVKTGHSITPTIEWSLLSTNEELRKYGNIFWLSSITIRWRYRWRNGFEYAKKLYFTIKLSYNSNRTVHIAEPYTCVTTVLITNTRYIAGCILVVLLETDYFSPHISSNVRRFVENVMVTQINSLKTRKCPNYGCLG